MQGADVSGGARTYHVVARVLGETERQAQERQAQDRQATAAGAGYHWENCARGKRHAFFAYACEADTLGAGDALLETGGDSTAGVYAAISRDVLQRWTLEVGRAGLTGEKFADAGLVKNAVLRIGQELSHENWEYDHTDYSETAMYAEVRGFMTNFIQYRNGLPLGVAAEVVDCLVRAVPAVRAGGAPVFAVEAGGDGCFFVTSYFPAAMRHTVFEGVPLSVQSAGGLWYDVAVLEDAPVRLTLMS